MYRQHGPDAASRTEAGVAILFVNLFHHNYAKAQLAQKQLVRVGRVDGDTLRDGVRIQIVEYGL